jgi:hypothetical protein
MGRKLNFGGMVATLSAFLIPIRRIIGDYFVCLILFPGVYLLFGAISDSEVKPG